MRKLILILSLITLSIGSAKADDPPTVTVVEPFIELRTGPGRGYPVFHVVAANDQVKILKRRTNWFLLETFDRRSKQGWAKASDMRETAAKFEGNDPVYASFPGFDRGNPSSWSWHASGGDFGGASAISAAAIFNFTRNIKLQLEGTQILGDFSDGKMIQASVQHHPFPTWRVSPYFQLGAGVLQTQPSATLVQATDRTDNTLLVGGGVQVHLGQRFNLFMDYRRHTVLTSRDQNEEIDQWNFGINVSL